jgi:glycosyltransferase involved in cell wall biosynthesis
MNNQNKMAGAKKKIIFRNRSLEMGGIETVLLNILNHLDQDRYEIVLLLNYLQGEFIDRVPAHIRVLAVGENSENFSKNVFLKFFQKIKRRLKYGFFEIFPSYFYKKNLLLDFDFEVAFSHYMMKSVLKSPNRKSKKIFWIHGDLRNSGFDRKQNQKFVDEMQQFDQGIFVSKHGKNVVEKNWNLELKNAEVFYNPLNIKQIQAKSTEAVEEKYHDIDFVAVGRLFVAKGFADLVEAHHQLISEGYKIKTLLIGDGIQRKELENLIEKYKLKESFFLHGFSENPVKYVQNARYFVLPSYSESYPMVIGESLILNKPVLATNVGGVSEMVKNEVNGLLFKPGKSDLYKTMKRVLDEPNLAKKLSAQDSLTEFQNRNEQIFKQVDQLFN